MKLLDRVFKKNSYLSRKDIKIKELCRQTFGLKLKMQCKQN